MNKLEAINKRCSRRSYTDSFIEESKVKHLQQLISKINKEQGLNFQFVVNNSDAFNNFRKTYGFFKNVNNYIAIIGKKDDISEEKAGYFGELIVLEATMLNLGTCWIGARFDRAASSCLVREDEFFYGVISIGNVEEGFSLKEKLISQAVHRKSKKIEELYESNEKVPQWFITGMEAVQKAPSERNIQPVMFYYKNNIVTAKLLESEYGYINLGIAKLHFEIGAGDGKWEFGKDGCFIRKQ